MNKLYNKNTDISTNLQDFFKEIDLPLSESRHNLLAELIIAIILAESAVISDITKKTFSFDNIHDESLQRKIRRFFKSKKFDPYKIFDSFIKHIIDNYFVKKNNPRVHIVIDHMFCNDKFTVLMFTLRIGKQGFPIFFRCFEATNNPNAFDTNLIIEGINYIFNLFKNKNLELIFLADRWFPNTTVLEHINSLNCTYVFRTKKEHKIRYFDSKENHFIWKPLSDFSHQIYHTRFLENIDYTFKNPIKANIVLARTIYNEDDPWILVTNGDPTKAVRDYSYRFGAIECNFKNNKTNGFYIESTKIKNIESFVGMYLLVNIATIWLTIIGSDYLKNKNYYSKKLAIRDTKKTKTGRVKRVISLFNLGLIIFNKLFNKTINLRLKCNFILYDV